MFKTFCIIMDLREILKNPSRKRNEFSEWVKDFPLNEESTSFICNLVKKVGKDYSYMYYILLILNSDTVRQYPSAFIDLIEKCNDNFYVKLMKGLLFSTFRIHTLEDMEKEDNATRLGFIIGIVKQEGLSNESENEIRNLWNLKDNEIMPTLIRYIACWAEERDFSDLFLGVSDEYLSLLLMNISDKNVNSDKVVPLLRRAISLNERSANAAWCFIHSNVNDNNLIVDLCIQTLKKYITPSLSSFGGCIMEKVEDNPELVTLIVEDITELDYFNKRSMWGILAEGNPEKTVEESVRITFEDDGTEEILEELGGYFSEIKAGIYSSGTKEDCIKLYGILRNWLRNRDFFSVESIPEEDMERYNENYILGRIHEITERLIWIKPGFEKEQLMDVLREFSEIDGLLRSRIRDLLIRKEYHPVLNVLRNASDPRYKISDGAREVLNKIEYYFNYFPTVENQYCKNNAVKATKEKVGHFFGNLYTFLSECFIFERLHKADVILVCEPNIGGKYPDFLIEINGKKMLVEVKNCEEPEESKISGAKWNPEEKFKRNFRGAFFQTVPMEDIYPRYPVVILFDVSRSHILPIIIDQIMHGSYSFAFSSEDPEKLIPCRGRDYLAYSKELAKFIQAVGLFKPNMADKKLVLEGNLVKHRYREDLIEISELQKLSDILFAESLERGLVQEKEQTAADDEEVNA